MDHTLHCNSFFYWGIYRSFNDRLERQLQIITSSANPSKTNFGPQDPNKVSSAIDTWGHQSRFTSYIYSSADICLLTIQVLANALILFFFSRPLAYQSRPPTSNILWPKFAVYEFICVVSKTIPNFQSVNLLDVKDQHHYLQILFSVQLHNDHHVLLCSEFCILCNSIMMIMPQWDRREDCRWRLKCFQSKYCPYSPFAELKQ